ncbi:fascin domain-containing protein [Pendulispora albinea]|uniref:Uncharacterized protein n=1 Tax=Pendulispora albinea TaxID=2741071 RepID=A0ABZ2LXC0_9BACT
MSTTVSEKYTSKWDGYRVACVHGWKTWGENMKIIAVAVTAVVAVSGCAGNESQPDDVTNDAITEVAGATSATPAGAPSVEPMAPAVEDVDGPRALSDVVAERTGRSTQETCTSNVAIASWANNRFVSAEIQYGGGSYGMLRARAAAVDAWELYTVCYYGSYWTLRSQANGLFVSAEIQYGGSSYGMLRARASVADAWEQFAINSCGTGCASIQSLANGLFVSAEVQYGGASNGMLRARASVVDAWEMFR